MVVSVTIKFLACTIKAASPASTGKAIVMAAAALLLGVPALGHLLGNESWVGLLFSALRGIGFGALTVAENALIAEITPPRLLGKATGMIGVFVGFSQMLFLPAGIAMGQAWGFGTVYISSGPSMTSAMVSRMVARASRACSRACARRSASKPVVPTTQ